jgi:anti-sigma regulatory factor (Ser/Thr protein kinase)
VTTLLHERPVQGLACDRCGRWEVGPTGVADPDTWVEEGSADAHLCPRCVIGGPAWTQADVDALKARTTRALARSMDLREEFRAVQAQAVQVLRVRARRPSLVVTLPAVTGSVRVARKLATAFGEGTGVPSDDLGLLTSELVTNAILHAGLPPDGRVSVHVRLDGHGMHVAVGDHGPGLRPHPVPDGAASAGGQGLRLIDTLASGWGSGPGHVWFRLDR